MWVQTVCIVNQQKILEIKILTGKEIKVNFNGDWSVSLKVLTLKAPILTAADDKFSDIFPNF